MKAMVLMSIIAMFSAVCPAFAQEDESCIQQYRAESARIEQEFMVNLPDRSSRESMVNWSKALHAALGQAARNAEECSSMAAKARVPFRQQAEQDCSNQAHRAYDDLMRLYGNRDLSSAEQTTFREEQSKLNDNLNDCLKAARNK